MAKKEDESAKEFSAAVKELAKASNELSQNTGKEVGKIVGKDLLKVTDPFVKSFNQIPGVQTLGNVGKTLFNKGFAALKDKREKELLRKRIGLGKEEFKNLTAQKRLNDALAKEQEKFGEAAKSLLGFDPEGLEKALMGNTNELSSFIRKNTETLEEQNKQEEFRYNKQQSTASKRGNRAAADEKAAEEAANEKKNQSLLESMANGITTLNKSFLAGLKDTGKFALAGLAALIAAPVVMLVSFFKSLSVEFAFLTKLVKGGFRRVTAPLRFIGRMFNSLIQLNKTAGAGPVQKAILGIEKLGKTIFSPFEKMGNFLRAVKAGGLEKTGNLLAKVRPILTSVLTTLKNFFGPVGRFFSTIFDKIATFTKLTNSANGIMKFAGTVGNVLGKLFLPVTILMGAFDLITGFIDGFTAKKGSTAEKVFAGLKEGLAKLFGNMIGAPLDLLKKGVAWVLKKFGFDESSEALKKFSFKDLIMDIVRAPFRLVEKIVDIIQNFDFSSLLPNNEITRTLGLVKDKDEVKVAMSGEGSAAARANVIVAEIARLEGRLKSGGYMFGSDRRKEESELASLQKEATRLKAELEAQRAAGRGTNVNASTTVTDARQSKTTHVTGAPIVDTTAAGALASAK